VGYGRRPPTRPGLPLKKITTLDDPRYVKALSHPLRVRILAILEERTASPVQLAEQLDASLGVVSYHVRTLERLGLIKLVRTNPVRGAVEHHYRANPRPTISDDGWDAAPPVAKQAFLSSFLQQVQAYTGAAAAAGGFDRADAHFTRTVAKLDAKGWTQLAKACEQLLARIDAIEADSGKRIAKDPHADGIVDAGLVIMLFEAARLAPPEPKRRHTRRPQSTGARRSG
jgi:DNA-binding transcriptional ArsR family regulator